MVPVYSGKIMLLNILPGSLGASIPQLQTKITTAGVHARCQQGWCKGPEVVPQLAGRVRQVLPVLPAGAKLLCTALKERTGHVLTG